MSRAEPLQREQYRHELKFVISEWEQQCIRRRIGLFFHADKHARDGLYLIRSLYFDNYQSASHQEKLMGISRRKKYRVRIYNYSDNVIRLERKKKVGAYIHKEGASITRTQLEAVLAGEYACLLDHPANLCREFYHECVSYHMRPAVIVDYEREPYVCPVGDVRITFDTNIRAGATRFDVFDRNLPVFETMEPGQLVMEVKFTELLPSLVSSILPTSATEYRAVSKYVLCHEKLRNQNRIVHY